MATRHSSSATFSIDPKDGFSVGLGSPAGHGWSSWLTTVLEGPLKQVRRLRGDGVAPQIDLRAMLVLRNLLVNLDVCVSLAPKPLQNSAADADDSQFW